MAFSASIDYFGDKLAGGNAQQTTVEHGREFFVIGWTADVQAGQVAKSIFGIVDGRAKFNANPLVRIDVADHFGNQALEACGFDLGFDTSWMTLGEHVVQVVAESPDGTLTEVAKGKFTLVPSLANVPSWPRILIAGAPKSGSTFTRYLLQRYFGAQDPPPGEQGGDYNLDSKLLSRARGRQFVLSMHVRAYRQNLMAAERENIATVVTWRNLADTVVSFDDHIRKQTIIGPNVLFHLERSEYEALPDQKRYQCLISYALPWFVSFYLAWKSSPRAYFAHYEEMARDSFEHFSKMIRWIAGEVDEQRLREALERPMSQKQSNKNVGKNYRSLEALSDESKQMIEDLLRRHYHPLDELVAELPWNVSAPNEADVLGASAEIGPKLS